MVKAKGFGNRLRAAREKRDLSVRKLAKKASLSAMYLSQIERGVVDPPADEKIQSLAEALGDDSDSWFAAAGRLAPDLHRLLSSDPTFRWNVVRHLKWGELRRHLQSTQIHLAVVSLFDEPPVDWINRSGQSEDVAHRRELWEGIGDE
jgi:transcriptional regulator with XRE-family HTH domain